MLNAWLIWFLFRNKKKAPSNEQPHQMRRHHVQKGMTGAEMGGYLVIIAVGAVFLTSITTPFVGFVVAMVSLVALMALA